MEVLIEGGDVLLEGLFLNFFMLFVIKFCRKLSIFGLLNLIIVLVFSFDVYGFLEVNGVFFEVEFFVEFLWILVICNIDVKIVCSFVVVLCLEGGYNVVEIIVCCFVSILLSCFLFFRLKYGFIFCLSIS